MPQGPDEFDDPVLKAALQRARGGHSASPQLRQRVTQVLESAGSSGARAGFRVTGRVWLAAACVLLAVAGAIYLNYKPGPEVYLADNVKLLDAMVGMQSVEPAGASTIAITSQTKPADVQQQLATKLGRPIPAPDLSAAGWKLTAAGVLPFENKSAGRLIFEKGPRQIMLVSLPADAFRGAHDNEAYECQQAGHPIAGYISAGSLNCVVGDTDAVVAEMVTLRDRLRGL